MSFKETLENLRTLDLQSLLRDFKGLDPNDPGQWPLAPRVATLLAIFLVIVVGGWWFDAVDAEFGRQLRMRRRDQHRRRLHLRRERNERPQGSVLAGQPVALADGDPCRCGHCAREENRFRLRRRETGDEIRLYRSHRIFRGAHREPVQAVLLCAWHQPGHVRGMERL